MTRQAGLFLLLASLFTGSAAHAESAAAPAAEASVGEARQRFQRGVELYKEGNYVAALGLFSQYLELGGDEIDAERRAQVQEDIGTLRSRVAELTVRANVTGARLLIDGVEVSALPLAKPILINSGVRQISVQKPGYRSAQESVTVPGGAPLALELRLEPEPAATTTVFDPAVVEPQEGGLGAPFWISLVATGVLGGAAVTFAVLTNGADGDLDDELSRFPADAGRVEDARDDLKRYALLTDAFAAGAVLAAGATIYFGVSGASREAPRRTTGLRLRPGLQGSRLLLHGEF